MKNKKQMIIDYLMDDGVSSTTKIASVIKSNNLQTEQYLMELEKEKKVKRLENAFTYSTYWNIKSNKILQKVKKEVHKK